MRQSLPCGDKRRSLGGCKRGFAPSDLFHAVVADSFDGRTLNARFADNLLAERNAAKADPQARQFYQWCQGDDWETVVDRDTEALLQCAEENRRFCAGR